jgi:hypothetical protein
MAPRVPGEWKEALQTVWGNLTTIAHIDNVFWQVQAIIAADPELNKPGAFQEWLGLTYTSTVTVGLRRLTESDARAVSLITLLHDMKKETTAYLTRSRFVEDWEPRLRRVANKSFDALCGGPHRHIPESRFDEHESSLRQRVDKIVKFTNAHVTHASKKSTSSQVSFGEFRSALVEAFIVARWCYVLIENGTPVSPALAIQGNWLRVFRRAWLPEKGPAPPYRHIDELIRERVNSNGGVDGA